MYVIPNNTKIITCSHCDVANTATLALCPFLSEPAQLFLVHFSAVQLSCASARAALSHLQSQGTAGEKDELSAPFHHSALPPSSPRDATAHAWLVERLFQGKEKGQGTYPIPMGLKEENISQPLWCFRIYHKLKPFRDTAQSHKGDNCDRKVRWVQKQQQKNHPISRPHWLFPEVSTCGGAMQICVWY